MSRFRVALSGDFMTTNGHAAFPDFDLSPIRDRSDIELDYVRPVDGTISAESLRDYDALILLAPKVSANSIAGNDRLALVARFGVGYDNVDVGTLADNGIATVTTPKAVGRPVAVGILTLILSLTGKVVAKHQLAREGASGFAKRARYMGTGLTGKTLGIVGLGNIGSELVRICTPLDLQFIAHDPFVDKRLASDLGVRLVELDEVFRESDIVTINCPLNPETFKLINADRLSLMRSTAYLVNTARGPIVDQVALYEALRDRRIAGAGLDVFDPEPPVPGDPLLDLDNVVLSPHGIAWTDQCFAAVGAADVRAVLDVMQGREPEGIVDRRVTAHPLWQQRLRDYAKRFSR